MATDPDLNELFERLDLLEEEGALAEAVGVLDRTIAAGVSDPEVFAIRGFFLFQLNSYGDAMRDLDSALKQKPDAKQTLFMRAQCKEHLEDFHGALEDYALCEQLGLSDVWVHLNVGMIREYLGDLTGARDAFDKAVRMNSDLQAERAKMFLAEVDRKIAEQQRQATRGDLDRSDRPATP